jgi:lipopolysaccharide export LptBFGC system permease protein LptF
MSPFEVRGQTMRYRRDPSAPGGGRRADAQDPSIRASDAERAEVADNLSRHFADGRLDQPEFKTRLDRAMEATTRGDLGGLFDDLPRLPSQDAPEPQHQRRFFPAIAVIVVVSLVLSLAAVANRSGDFYFHFPWPIFLVAGFLLWRRARRHHPHDGGRPEIGGG